MLAYVLDTTPAALLTPAEGETGPTGVPEGHASHRTRRPARNDVNTKTFELAKADA